MDRDETKKLLMGIQCSFPNFKIQDGLLGFTVDVWQDDLAEYSYNDVYAALKTYKSTSNSGFAPSTSQLIEMIHQLKKNPNQMNGNEAWALVYKAICNSNYNAESEFNKLPPIVQKCVGCPDNLRAMASDPEFNMGVEQSHFIRIYDTECKRAEFNEKIPEGLRIAMENVTMIGAST